jgi:RNA ligase
MDFLVACVDDGQTPIFEFTAPENRIVLRYNEPQLTLLAIREMVSGQYVDPGVARSWAHRCGIPHVQDIGRVGDDVGGFVDRIRALEEEEGVVVCFMDGHRIKLKADEYVKKHKALDGLQSKKSALALVLDDLVDDVIPLLDEADAEELADFECAVGVELNDVVERAQNVVLQHGHKGRKEFAVNHASTLPQEQRSLAFTILDGKDGWEAAKNIARRNPDFIKTKWRGE